MLDIELVKMCLEEHVSMRKMAKMAGCRVDALEEYMISEGFTINIGRSLKSHFDEENGISNSLIIKVVDRYDIREECVKLAYKLYKAGSTAITRINYYLHSDVLDLLDKGTSTRQIANELGVSKSNVFHIKKYYQDI